MNNNNKMEKVTHELKQLRKLAALLQSAWHYGEWKAETPNEREMEAIMREQGLWPVTMSAETWELNLKLNQIQHDEYGNPIPPTGGGEITVGRNNNPGNTNNNTMNMTVLRKHITMYLDDLESYGTRKDLADATDVLFDFVKYINAMDGEQAMIDYNAMEEEWEMDNYNEMQQ